MKQWDTMEWEFPHGRHPCVIISTNDRCSNPALPTVNVLACQSQRAQRGARLNEVILDAADGMDWETLCRVDFVWVAPKAELTRTRKAVGPYRQRELGRKLAAWFGF